MAFQSYMESFLVSPTLLRVVRVFRVGRVLRLVKSAKGIRTLLFSLAVSMPALFNIGLLLFLVMFIYGIFGMNFFMHVKHTEGIDDLFNFETFGRSMIVLFELCTSAGWAEILGGLLNTDDCDPNHLPESNCGKPGMGVLYVVTYLVVSFLVVINMYIAVILENFSQATEDVQKGLTQDDFDMYYEIWEKFDEKATQYIPFERLSEFVDTLEEPLQIPNPNFFKLVSLEIPICEGEKVHCVDILDALTKNFLGTSGDDMQDVKKGPTRKDYVPVTNTLKRQRHRVCARIIQRAWRKRILDRKMGLNPGGDNATGGSGGGGDVVVRIDDVTTPTAPPQPVTTPTAPAVELSRDQTAGDLHRSADSADVSESTPLVVVHGAAGSSSDKGDTNA